MGLISISWPIAASISDDHPGPRNGELLRVGLLRPWGAISKSRRWVATALLEIAGLHAAPSISGREPHGRGTVNMAHPPGSLVYGSDLNADVHVPTTVSTSDDSGPGLACRTW